MSKNKKPKEQNLPNKQSLSSNKIFIDADAFIALSRADDSNHRSALKIQRLVEKKDPQVFTSNFAFGEAVTIISQKSGIVLAMAFSKETLGGEIVVIDISREHLEKALAKFSQQTTKNTRFTDMVNMVLMDELKIDTIFSYDEHYKKNGYKLLEA